MKVSLKEKIKKSSKFKRIHRKLKIFLAQYFYKNDKHLPKGYHRIYHYHIRKSGGTSINAAFWKLSDLDLNTFGREPIVNRKAKTYVRNSKKLIQDISYFYANSHFPFWDIQLQPNTFTFTILRNPYDRIVSLYKYYSWVYQVEAEEGRRLDPSYDYLIQQKHLLNKNFKNFIDALSEKYLFGQLFFYSKEKNIEEAIENLSKVHKVFFLENYDEILTKLNRTLNLNLIEPEKQRSFDAVIYQIDKEDKEYAIGILDDEIEFYTKARKIFS